MIEKKLETALEYIRQKTDFIPDVAVTLGSGLGGFADEVEHAFFIDYCDIPGMPVSTAPGHKGRFVFGKIAGVKVAVMQGRIHYYEGHDIADTVMPLRLLRKMGAKFLILTNAAGGINPDFEAGDFMLVDDHISFFVPSPLRGKNPDSLGVRFPDMSNVYDKDLRRLADAVAKRNGITLKHGVLVQTAGPNFETPAEIRFLRTIGADAVGMSTVVEAMAACHCNFRTLTLTCISNLAAGVTDNPLSLEEVMVMAKQKAPQFRTLLHDLIGAIKVHNGK